MKIKVPQKVGNCVSDRVVVSQRRTALHGVNIVLQLLWEQGNGAAYRSMPLSNKAAKGI